MSRVHPFPHHYTVSSECHSSGTVVIDAERLAPMDCLPPPQFGGPGDHWSPETLFLGALSSCFALTFRAIARLKGLEWQSLHCRVDAVLEREQGNSRFTEFLIHADLRLAIGQDEDQAGEVLNQAKRGCLISNSLSGMVKLEVVMTDDNAE